MPPRQSSLSNNATNRSLRKFVPHPPRHRPRLGRVSELPMTTDVAHLNPTHLLQLSHDVSHLHGANPLMGCDAQSPAATAFGGPALKSPRRWGKFLQERPARSQIRRMSFGDWARRSSAGSPSSTCPHMQTHWSGRPSSPSPAAAHRRCARSCSTRWSDRGRLAHTPAPSPQYRPAAVSYRCCTSDDPQGSLIAVGATGADGATGATGVLPVSAPSTSFARAAATEPVGS